MDLLCFVCSPTTTTSFTTSIFQRSRKRNYASYIIAFIPNELICEGLKYICKRLEKTQQFMALRGYRRGMSLDILDMWKTYPHGSAGDFQQREVIGQPALLVELLQWERHCLLNLGVVKGDMRWTVRTGLTHPSCRNWAEKNGFKCDRFVLQLKSSWRALEVVSPYQQNCLMSKYLLGDCGTRCLFW